MINIRHLLRAKRLVQNPPSWRRVKLVFAVIALCLMIVALDYLELWPEWAQVEKTRRPF